MTLKVKFDNGDTETYEDNSAVEIVNFPPREQPAAGYQLVREYPPEYVKTTTFHPNVIAVGSKIMTASGVRTVVEATRLP
jgi:hypothetical protein